MRFWAILALVVAVAAAQPAPKSKSAKPDLSEAEQEELSSALAEAGSSPVEFLRALERHLAKYPKSPRRAELERAALRAAIETKDERRIILYGSRVLDREADDIQMLERVTRALLATGDADDAK